MNKFLEKFLEAPFEVTITICAMLLVGSCTVQTIAHDWGCVPVKENKE